MPLIRTTDIDELGINYSSLKYVTKEFHIKNKKSQITKGDLIIARHGENGKANVFKEEYEAQVLNAVIIEPDQTKIESNLLKYYFDSPFVKKQILSVVKGSVQGVINTAHIADVLIPISDNINYSGLSKIINDLDSKIELNNRINAELEAMAKTIYDYWFVQFDFPDKDGKPYKSSGGKMVWNEELKREIPEGWGVKRLVELITIKNGKDHKNLSTGPYPVYGSGGVIRYVNKFLYDSESILIPRKGSLGNLFYVNQPFWSVDTIFFTQISFNQSCKYLYYSIQLLNIAKMNTGTAVPSMTASILNNLILGFPTLDILKSFDETLQPIFNHKDSLLKENQHLASLRDWLLPMLMNGQVKVN